MVGHTDPDIPGEPGKWGIVFGLDDHQRKWWFEKGKKKYPSLCYDEAEATYSLIWSSDRSSNISLSILEIVPKEKKQTPPIYFTRASSGQKALEAGLKFLYEKYGVLGAK